MELNNFYWELGKERWQDHGFVMGISVLLQSL